LRLCFTSKHQVKNATWFCLIALFVVFFGLVFIFIRISKLERLRLDAADVRVKVLNEMMQGIKVIKLMGMFMVFGVNAKLSPVLRVKDPFSRHVHIGMQSYFSQQSEKKEAF